MGDTSILGIGGTRPTDPSKSAASSSTGQPAPGSGPPQELEPAEYKSAGNARITRQRGEAEWEKTPAAEATGRTYPPSSHPLPSRKGVDQPQTDQQDTKNNKLEDLPLKGANAQGRPEQERYRSVQASGPAVQPTDCASAPITDFNERGKRGAVEPGGPPGRADERSKQPPKRTSKALWAAVVLLALGLAGVTGYGYLMIHQNAIAQLPAVVELEQLVGALRGRMEATDAKLRDLTGDWASLSKQVAALSTKMRSSLENARKHTEELVLQEQERIEAEMAQRDKAVNARLAQVESEQRAENERLAQVQDWVQKNLAGVHQEIAAQREDSGRDLKGLHQDVDQSRSDLQRLARKVEPQRVDFEAAKNKEQQLVPGISLTVTRTDARYQRFEGYLELIEDSRTLWLSKVEAQQAVPFYLKQGGQPYDLVVTSVTRQGVVGYLLVPQTTSNEMESRAFVAGSQRSSGGSF